jgi:hypothetical protein
MRRVLLSAFILLTLLPRTAQAVTAKEILELSRAGLSEEVLLALIEVDGGVFTLDTDMLKRLKDANVSDRVILAMVRSGRTPQVEPTPVPVAPEQAVDPAPIVAPQPQVIVIEHERPVVEQVAVPVYVAVPQGRFISRGRRLQSHVQQPFDPSPGFGAPIVLQPFDPSPGFGAPLPPTQQQVPAKKELVFWGWGGKLRPDAWKPPNYVEDPAPKPEPPAKK